MATFLIDRRRFHYPERPIIFLSFCYLVISLAYIVGSISKLVGGDQTSFACTTDETPSLPEHSRSFVFQRLPNDNAVYQTASCVILFVMVYYFQMASALWWVVLTLTWFLAAALKWGEEAVERLWLLYHIVSWSIPAMQIILILALRLVDGDQLAGLCYTGNHSIVGLGVFVFLPLAIYLLLGLIFLVIGFIALVKIRQQLQRDAAKSRKLGRPYCSHCCLLDAVHHPQCCAVDTACLLACTTGVLGTRIPSLCDIRGQLSSQVQSYLCRICSQVSDAVCCWDILHQLDHVTKDAQRLEEILPKLWLSAKQESLRSSGEIVSPAAPPDCSIEQSFHQIL